jgi:competence protein ComEC
MSGIPRTPVNRTEFDYKEYLEEKGIRTAISYPKIKLVERDQGNPILTAIYTLRRNMSQSLSKALPEPQNSLAQGILLGLRSSIPQQLKNAFSSTGTTHILAISGHNLSIFIGICLAIGIWIFGRKHRIYIWLALGITWAYTLLSGMSPPVIRSALMISLFLAAELLGRQRHSMNALLFAAAVMTAFNPHVLRDVSFQLSFMAMSGLIVLSPGLISRGLPVRSSPIISTHSRWSESRQRSLLHLHSPA